MRWFLGNVVTAVIICSFSLSPGAADEVRIASWNLEHLADADGEGCLGRKQADYDTLRVRTAQLDADIVAFQEVENAAAARRVFPEAEWRVEMSSRPPMSRTRPCWDRPEEQLGHLGTGFAVRKGIAYRRNRDVEELGVAHPFQRWGTDITVTVGNRDLRLLSVHLRSGCWGARQDEDRDRENTCSTLRAQISSLRDWADRRRHEGSAFVVLGDFNRRLALPGDWAWTMLSPRSAPLHLVAEDAAARCDPRFPAFIDHLVAGGGAETLLVPGSFREAPRQEPHPDHCAISALFRTGD